MREFQLSFNKKNAQKCPNDVQICLKLSKKDKIYRSKDKIYRSKIAIQQLFTGGAES